MKRAWYSDNACSIPEISIFPVGVPNPLILPFNGCPLYFDNTNQGGGQTQLYQKPSHRPRCERGRSSVDAVS
jgi:hypothetical protein